MQSHIAVTASCLMAFAACRGGDPDRNPRTDPAPTSKEVRIPDPVPLEGDPTPHYERRYAFSVDGFTKNIPVWKKLLAPLAGKPNLRYLEIGIFEGRSAIWMLENVLTHPTARLVGIDPFPGDLEHKYLANLSRSGHAARARTIVGYSQTEMMKMKPRSFDIIYIDGSHRADSVMADAVLAWQLLEPGGLVIFDDYQWTGISETESLPDELLPGPSIDAFISAYRNEIEVAHRGYQMALRKKTSPCSSRSDCTPIGDHYFLWWSKKLFDAKGNEVEISSTELRLLKAIGRSRRPGQARFTLPKSITEDPTYQKMVQRLGLRL